MPVIAENRSNRPRPTETTEMLVARSIHCITQAGTTGNLIFDGHTPTATERALAQESRTLCAKIERRLDSCAAHEIAQLLGCHKLLTIIGHSRMPDPELIAFHRRRAIAAWKNGNKRIEESDIFGLIAADAACRPESTDRETAEIYHSLKARWVATLLKHHRFPDVTTKENFDRLALIMSEDLDSTLGHDQAADLKRRCWQRNRLADPSTLSPTLLRSYRRLLASLPPTLLPTTHQQSPSHLE